MIGNPVVTIQAQALPIWFVGPAHFDALVPVEAQPAEAFDDVVLELLSAPLGIGVVGAHDEGSTVAAGEQPVVQSSPAHPHMEEAGR